MNILDDIVSALNLEAAVQDVRQGPFQTAVLTRNCGLASTPSQAHQRGEVAVRDAGCLLENGSLELARLAYSRSPLEAAIGMATINSLLTVDERHCSGLNAADLLAQNGAGKNVALVGHFPFVPELRQAVEALWVIERNPGEGDFAESEAEQIIPEADVVGITGSAFIDHTIENLLALCSPEAYVVVLGGTTPLSPVLFDYGVDAISGTRVVDSEAALRCVSQGANFRQIKGVRLLTMEKQGMIFGSVP